MSLARRHRERFAAMQAATLAARDAEHPAGPWVAPAGPAADGATPSPVSRQPASIAEAQIRSAFAADLRRLKGIRSLRAKIDVKRLILPNYAAWVEGWLQAAAAGDATEDDVVASVLVWRIDTGDYAGALEIARPMLAAKLAMPARYQRPLATLLVEEIANAALSGIGRGEAFDVGILQDVAQLTDGEDMHDEVRAKILKAIGLEFARQAATETDQAHAQILRTNALLSLKQAVDLDARSGVKKEIERLARALRATP